MKQYCKRFAVIVLVAALLLPQTSFFCNTADLTATGKAYSLAYEPDYSELNVATSRSYMAGEGSTHLVDEGGFSDEVAAYFARWDGPISEESDPYRYDDLRVVREEPVLHIHDVLHVEGADDDGYGYVDTIKQAVLQFGGATISYNTPTGSFFNTAPDGTENRYVPDDVTEFDSAHAVELIGWDDAYPKEYFQQTPPIDGAFLVKNSWGSFSSPFFYISYADSSLIHSIDIFKPYPQEDTSNTIYQYDLFGATTFVDRIPIIDVSPRYVANVFPQTGETLSSDETLQAISLYTKSSHVSYTAYIVENVKNKADMNRRIRKGDCRIQKGEIECAGYHVIDLQEPLTLRKGTRFAVAVTLSDAQYGLEFALKGYTDEVRAGKGESYCCIKNISIDINSVIPSGNWSIKAFTKREQDVRAEDDGNLFFDGVSEKKRVTVASSPLSVQEVKNWGIELNPEFIAYIQGKKDFGALRPSPLLYAAAETDPLTFSADLPAAYDLRDIGCVTTVKDQGFFGLCWAFAAVASLESNVLLERRKDSVRFDDAVNLQSDRNPHDIVLGSKTKDICCVAAEDDIHTIRISSADTMQVQVYSEYGILLRQYSGSEVSLCQSMRSGEKLYFRISGTAAQICFYSESRQYIRKPISELDLRSAQPLAVEVSESGTISAGQIQLYKLTADPELLQNDGIAPYLRLQTNAPVYAQLIASDQYDWVEEGSLFLEAYEAGESSFDHYMSAENDLYMVLFAVDHDVTYTLQWWSDYSDVLFEEMLPEARTVSGDETWTAPHADKNAVLFTPPQDGWYRVETCSGSSVSAYTIHVWKADGSSMVITDEKDVKGDGFRYLPAGETYLICFYVHEKGDCCQIHCWGSEDHTQVPLVGETVWQHLYESGDKVQFSFTATAMKTVLYEIRYNCEEFRCTVQRANPDSGEVTEQEIRNGLLTPLSGGETIKICIYAPDDPEMSEVYDYGQAVLVTVQTSEELAPENAELLPSDKKSVMACSPVGRKLLRIQTTEKGITSVVSEHLSAEEYRQPLLVFDAHMNRVNVFTVDQDDLLPKQCFIHDDAETYYMLVDNDTFLIRYNDEKMIQLYYCIKKGKTQKIETTTENTIEDPEETPIIWESSDPQIATVSNGTVTAQQPGEVFILEHLPNGNSNVYSVTVLRYYWQVIFRYVSIIYRQIVRVLHLSF